MSLDVYLIKEDVKKKEGSGIFIRENGSTREISKTEWDNKFPGTEPVVLVDDGDDTRVYWDNITHNLGEMASAAGIYKHLWRPEEIGITKAGQLIEPLSGGLDRLRKDQEKFIRFNPTNGWGSYSGLVSFVEDYLEACSEYPDADVEVSR